MKRTILTCFICISAIVSGCGGEQDLDLKSWMNEQGASSRGKIPPIPPIRPYEAFTYDAASLADPFKPKKLESGSKTPGPDEKRRKEVLESFQLDTLRMVGTLQRNKETIGLVSGPDRRVYQVRTGNYMGQNYGVITSVTDAEISLKELFQDGAGDWVERQTTMTLQERELKK